MLMVETDEKGHADRDPNYERKRRKDLEKVGYYFIRINPDKVSFVDYEEFGKVSAYIAESIKKQTEKSTKKSLIDGLSKGLLAIEFKSDHSIKWKCLKWIAKKLLPDYKEWKTHNRKKKKTIKTWKEFRTTYCLGCKNYTHNFRSQEVKVTNKVLREKSNCAACRSTRSRFLKQK